MRWTRYLLCRFVFAGCYRMHVSWVRLLLNTFLSPFFKDGFIDFWRRSFENQSRWINGPQISSWLLFPLTIYPLLIFAPTPMWLSRFSWLMKSENILFQNSPVCIQNLILVIDWWFKHHQMPSKFETDSLKGMVEFTLEVLEIQFIWETRK